MLYLDFYPGKKPHSQLYSLKVMAKHPVDSNGAGIKDNRATWKDEVDKTKIFIPDMSESPTSYVCKVFLHCVLSECTTNLSVASF